jgi:creatinine amidohydrolase
MLIKWNELNKNQFELYKNKAIAALNVSSTEQHSDHLAVGTDAYAGEAVLEEAAQLAHCDVLVLPQIQYGFSPHHRFADGYITISHETLSRYVYDICCCVMENGFKKMVILNSHGGNSAYLHCAVNMFGEQYEDMMKIVVYNYWNMAVEEINKIRETETGGMGHAGEFETSLMMYLRPDLVDESAIRPDDPPAWKDPYYENDLLGRTRYTQFLSFDKIDPHGNVGQAQFASAEKGKLFFEAVTKGSADFFDHFAGL